LKWSHKPFVDPLLQAKFLSHIKHFAEFSELLFEKYFQISDVFPIGNFVENFITYLCFIDAFLVKIKKRLFEYGQNAKK